MWLLIVREPRPDAAYWTGRRWLAAVDAAAWPFLWLVLLEWMRRQVPGAGRLAVSAFAAVALLCGLMRLRRALWVNHRYCFTTWRWGKVLGAMLLIGAVLKVAVTA